MPGDGADGRPRHLVVLVLDEPAQRVLERQGQPLRQAGRLEAGPLPEGALLRDHRLEERLRRLEPLLAQAGEHRHHRRADREVGEVAEVRQPRERVHVGVAREVEERLGPHLEVGIVQQRLDPRQDRPVARLVQDPEGPTAHLGVRVLEQAAHRGVGRGRVAADGHHVEGVQDLLRVHSLEPGGEHLGRLPVEHLGRGAIGVEAVLLQALAQRGHVAPVRPRGQDQPQADERQRHEAETDGPQPANRGEGDDREPGEGVAGPPRHGVDERLRGELHLGRHGQVEQLHRGPVDRVAQHLVDALEEHGGRQGAGDEEPSRPEEEADRQEEEDRAQAEPPQDAGGQEHLGRHAEHAHRRVERAEEGGEGVLRDERPLRHGLELPARDRGHERGEHHDPGDRPQVGGAQHQAEAVPQPVPRPGGVRGPADRRGPPPPEGANGEGREQQEGRHEHQQALGAEDAGPRRSRGRRRPWRPGSLPPPRSRRGGAPRGA